MINTCAKGWDDPGNYVGIRPGTMVPFQVGLLTVKAEILGTVRDGEQYLLLFRYLRQHDVTGVWYQVRRLYQRDRKLIEGLYQDTGGSI